MKPEHELCHYSEVTSATSDAKEKIRILCVAGNQDGSISSDDGGLSMSQSTFSCIYGWGVIPAQDYLSQGRALDSTIHIHRQG